MKHFKLLTLTTCISLTLAGCKNDGSANSALRTQPLAADEAIVTAIDGYLKKADVYALNADGECDIYGESIGETTEYGKIKGKKHQLENGYCVVATTKTSDSDYPEEKKIEIGFTLYAPKPEHMDAQWETKQAMVVTPFSHYLHLAIQEGQSAEEAKQALAIDLFGPDANQEHAKILFGDFIHYKKNAKLELKDFAAKSHGFARILVKTMNNKGEDAKLTLTEIKSIAKVAKSHFEENLDFLTRLEKGDPSVLITFSHYIWENIDTLASGDTAKVEALVNRVKAPEFIEALTKMPILDAKITKLQEDFEKALKNATFDMSTGLDLGNLELTGIKVKMGEEEVDVNEKNQLILTETFSTLNKTETRYFSTSNNATYTSHNATYTSHNATYDKNAHTLLLNDPLIIKEAGTYTYRLFVGKKEDDDTIKRSSNAAMITLSINHNTVPNFVVNKAPIYLGDESSETQQILKKFERANYLFEVTEQAKALTLNIDDINFRDLFKDESQPVDKIEIEAATDEGVLSEDEFTVNYQNDKLRMKILLPSSFAAETKEYRLSIKAMDAQGKKSKKGFNLSIFVSLDAKGQWQAIAKSTEIEPNKPSDGVLLQDLQIAVPITKQHEKALEETLETLLSGKTLATDYSLNELLPITGYLCEKEKDKQECKLQNIFFAGDYQLVDVMNSHSTVHNMLEIIEQSDFMSDFSLINQPEKDKRYTWYLDTTIFDTHSNLPLPVKYFEHHELDDDGNIKNFDKYKNHLRLEIDTKKDGKVKVDIKFDKTRKDTVVQPTTPSIQYDYIFPNGLASYKTGSRVLHLSTVYECKQGSLCTQWTENSNQYEPNVGTNWQMAWTKVGESIDVDLGFTQPDLPPDDTVDYEFHYPDSIQHYKKGTLVTRDGSTFQCIDDDLCQDKSKAYVPGIGSSWQLVWKNVGFAGSKIDPAYTMQPIAFEFHYPDGLVHYKKATLVEKDSLAYECLNTQLCRDQKNEPEVGEDWQKAWKVVGFASDNIDSGFIHQTVDYEFTYPDSITFYEKGTLIANNGLTFQCIDTSKLNLCKNLSAQYVPDVGSEWQKAWKIVGVAGSSIDSNVTPSAPIDYEFTYPKGIESYKIHTLVERDGITYQCLATDLCNEYVEQYEPAVGSDWQKAWEDIGFAGNKIDDGFITPDLPLIEESKPDQSIDYEFGYPTNISSYKAGTIVKYQNFAYQCKDAQLCKDLFGKHAPNVGEAWQAAWDKLGIAGSQLDASFGQ